MKKKIRIGLVLFIVCFTHFVSMAQYTFYDALKLANGSAVINGKIFIPNNPSNLQLLAAYLSKDSSSCSNIVSAFQDNPFITVAGCQLAASGSFKAPGISSLGSLNVTNLADGIASFLIKRGKEELNVAFFNRMKEFLEDPKHPECKTLFPVTTEFLGQIATYRYAELLQSLREAFYKDLSNLIVSLNQLIDHPKYKELLKNLPEIRGAIRCSKIVNELSQSETGILPDSLIHELAELPELQEISSNLGNSLKLLDIFSQSVREKIDEGGPADAPQGG